MHAVRQRKRVTADRVGLLGRRKLRIVIAGTAALAVIGTGTAYGTTTLFGQNHVGTEYADGLQVSSNQVLKPLGDRVSTPYGKIMGSTISPDGRFLAADLKFNARAGAQGQETAAQTCLKSLRRTRRPSPRPRPNTWQGRRLCPRSTSP